jgi:hypothetical protein
MQMWNINLNKKYGRRAPGGNVEYPRYGFNITKHTRDTYMHIKIQAYLHLRVHVRHLLRRAYSAGIRLHHHHACVLHVWMLLRTAHVGHVACGHGSCKGGTHVHILSLSLSVHEWHARVACLESYRVGRRSLEIHALVCVLLLRLCRVRHVHVTNVTRMRAGKIRRCILVLVVYRVRHGGV